MENNVNLARSRGDRIEVPHVADSELEHILVIAIDHVVRGRPPTQPLHPHLMLLRFIPREHDDPPRIAKFAGEEPSDDGLSQ